MKKYRRTVSIVIAFIMIFYGFGGLCLDGFVPAYASEYENEDVLKTGSSEQGLAIPTNLIWKDESTATAAWDAVEGANYYVVNVYVSVNGSEVGTAETGTTATEVDLQHEINSIIVNTNEIYNVQFDVKAQYIVDDEMMESGISSLSPTLVITPSGKPKLLTPTNLVISDDYTLTWDNYDNRSYYYHFYYRIEYNGRIRTGYASYLIRTTEVQNENGKATINALQALKNAYTEAGFSDELVSIQINLVAGASYDSAFSDSAFSQYSNSIIYSGGKAVLKTPTDLTLNENGILVWRDNDENTYFYNVYYCIEYDNRSITGYASMGITQREIIYEGDFASADVSQALKNAYDEAGFKGETVNISLRLLPCAYFDSDYLDGNMSLYSNSIEFTYEGKKQLSTPTNLYLNNDGTISWSSYDSEALYYNVYYKIEYNNKTKTGYASYLIRGNQLSPVDGIVTADFSQALKNAYDDANYSGETIIICLRIIATASSNSDFSDSDYSEYSNGIYYNPAGSTVIDEITLSPEHPVVAVGRTMYIGKTINPANAYYSKVNWSSDDGSVAHIDANGKITGAKKGNANITAQINNATNTIPVSVYEIASNVDDSEQSTEVMDTAKNAIDSLIVDGDATGTDINDVDAACEEIVQAAQNGDQFNVDVNIEEKEKNELDASWSDIQDVVGNKEFAAAYDVTVGISHTDSKGASHLIGNLTAFDSEVGFELEKPDNLPAVTENCNREFSLVRIHQSNIEEIPLTETDEGNYTATSKVFSDFVLLYKDVPCNHDYQNPVFNWSDDGKTCTVTYTCAINAEHKITYDCEVTSIIIEAATCSKRGTTRYTVEYGGLTSSIELEDIDIDQNAHDYLNGYCTICGERQILISGSCGNEAEYVLYADGELVISGVGELFDYAYGSAPWYEYRDSIKECKIEDGITFIGRGAFEECRNLELIQIPDSVTAIGNSTFQNCKKLTEVKLPALLEVIEGRLFIGCESLEHIDIPVGVTEIQYDAFVDCSGLKEIYVPDTVEIIAESAFWSNKASVYVKKGSYADDYLQGQNKTVIYTCKYGHVWNVDYTIDKQSTCKEEGSRSIHCSVCDVVDESTATVIPKADHTYGDWTVTAEATCTEDGTKEKVCFECGDKVTEVIPAKGHVWNEEYTTDKSATCTEEGSRSIHCSICGAIDETTVTVIPKADHTYGEWIVTKEATCTEEGTKGKICSVCGDKVTETIPETGHVWNEEYTIDKPATCSEEGSKAIHCSVCGTTDETTVTVIPKIDHTWGEGTVTKEPTYDKTGEMTYTCTVCGETYTEEIPALTRTELTDENVVLMGSTAFYSGEPRSFAVKCGSKFLTEGVDFEAKYINNTYIGDASVTITGKGDYTGTVTKIFKIVGDLERTATKVTVEPGSLGEYTYEGEPIEPEITKVTAVGKGTGEVVTLTEGVDYEVFYERNDAPGTGRVIINGLGYYVNAKAITFDIKAKTGWIKENGSWYYYGADGTAATGWQKIGGKWYYMDANGAMQTKWVKISGKWYYFNSSGVMQTGWQKIGSKQYFFKSSGAMAANEWVKGYYWINKDGTWTYKYKASWKKSGSKWWFGDTSGWYAKNTTITIDGKKYTFDAKGYMK